MDYPGLEESFHRIESVEVFIPRQSFDRNNEFCTVQKVDAAHLFSI